MPIRRPAFARMIGVADPIIPMGTEVPMLRITAEIYYTCDVLAALFPCRGKNETPLLAVLVCMLLIIRLQGL